MAEAKQPTEFDDAALDALLGETRTSEDLSSLFRQLQKRLAERILAGELTEHLGYAPGAPKPEGQTNHRNGATPKTVRTETGALPLDIPRDRTGSFRPQLVPTGVPRLPQFDANVLSLYARGMSVRDIQAPLETLDQVEVAPSMISAVTDEVMAEVRAGQERPLSRGDASSAGGVVPTVHLAFHPVTALKRAPPGRVHFIMAAASPLAAPHATLPAKRKGYWYESRSPRYSLTFALPLLVLYEALASALSQDANGMRNGADVLLKSAFQAVLGARGQLVFGVVLVGTMLAFIVRDVRRSPGGLKGSTFIAMLLESVVLAAVFGTVVGLLTAQLVGALVGGGQGTGLAMGALDGMGWPTAFMVSLGAGLYEELLFRVILVSVLLWGAKKLFGWGPVASGIFATLAAALIFSAFHYIGPFGDRLELGSFAFRAIAGVAFSALYIVRGFGITAWTHALYDVMLLVTRG